MRNLLITCAAAAMLASPAAALTSFDFRFDGTFDQNFVPPVIGTGSFSTPDTLGVGDHVLGSLSSYSFNFQFGSVTIDQSMLATPAANVVLRISELAGQRFLRFGGSIGGPFNGSMDFVNGGINLSFEPGFGARYFQNSNFGTFEAVSGGVVPEPASWAMLIAGFGLVGAVARRRNFAAA